MASWVAGLAYSVACMVGRLYSFLCVFSGILVGGGCSLFLVVFLRRRCDGGGKGVDGWTGVGHVL